MPCFWGLCVFCLLLFVRITGPLFWIPRMRGSAYVEELSDNIDGFQVPIDPMELLQCDSCQ
ncbi:unknown [Tropheryma whipplei str. Twist]|uniref:Uncharacterized protein n=1 Tax=Tropheryma whipplei (strain Twist) TaxID=203267 RepID=Q83FK4_TROWT|nr:unknown [Tropheryma whipplei str. Twist]